MSATTAHRSANITPPATLERLSAYLAHAIKWTFWPSVAATLVLLALGKPLLWLFGPQFTSGYGIMFVAAIGLIVRSAIGPVERLLNMLGYQNMCALAYALAFVMNLVLCVAAGAALRRLRRRRSDLDRAGVRDVLLFWITRSASVFTCWRSGRKRAQHNCHSGSAHGAGPKSRRFFTSKVNPRIPRFARHPRLE